MKTGRERKYHQRNDDRHGKRAKFDTCWFPLGNGQIYIEAHAHLDAAQCASLCETLAILHMTLLLLTAGSYSLESFHTTDAYSYCFVFIISQHVLPASHLKLSKSLILLLVSPLPSPLPTCALKGSLQLERKQTQQWIFN